MANQTSKLPAKKQQGAAKKKAMTKSQLRSKLAEDTGLTAKQVASVLDGLTVVALQQVKSVGSFTVPGLVKLTTTHKKATPERTGLDPFTKTEKVFKAKPARTVAKARVLKAVKDAVA